MRVRLGVTSLPPQLLPCPATETQEDGGVRELVTAGPCVQLDGRHGRPPERQLESVGAQPPGSTRHNVAARRNTSLRGQRHRGTLSNKLLSLTIRYSTEYLVICDTCTRNTCAYVYTIKYQNRGHI